MVFSYTIKQINMKKVILTVAILATSILGFAQEDSKQTFRESFRQMMESGIVAQSYTGTLTQSLESALASVKGIPGSTQEYVKNQMMNDVIDIMADYYEPYVTTEDMNFITNQFQKPEIKTANEHIQSLATDLNSGLASKMSKPIMNVLTGGTPEPVVLDDGISKTYFKACSEYCRKSDMLSTVESALNSIKSLPIPNEMLTNKLETIQQYLNANLPTMLANAYNGKVTVEDFKAMTKLFDTSAWQNFSKGNKALTSDMLNVAQKLTTKMAEYNTQSEQ